MTTEPKHTPTPWTHYAENGGFYIGHYSNTRRQYVAKIPDIDGMEQAEANAAFIVRAANMHDELMTRVKDMQAALAAVEADYDTSGCEGSGVISQETANVVFAALAKEHGEAAMTNGTIFGVVCGVDRAFGPLTLQFSDAAQAIESAQSIARKGVGAIDHVRAVEVTPAGHLITLWPVPNGN